MNALPLRLALVACDVFEEEVAAHLPTISNDNNRNATEAPTHSQPASIPPDPQFVVEVFLEMGLHDRPDILRQRLQQEIDALDIRDDIDAIILLYALCGRGTHGLRAGRHKLVIPRGHDCITVFLGDNKRFACQQAACPDSYYFTPGWMRGGRTPGPQRLEALRAEFAEKFEPDDVEFLIQQERANWAQHGRAVFTDLGTPEAETYAAKAEATAHDLGWKFERMPGDPSLLRDLLSGCWESSRFQIVAPGEVLEHSPDDNIFRTRSSDTP